MMAVDEDALLCDFAQYYRIYDIEQLPPRTAAVLAFGLPEECRIRRVLAGQEFSLETMLLAGIYDRVNLLAYFKTKAALSGENPPKSVLAQMMGQKEDTGDTGVSGFESPEAFEEYRKRILKEIEDGV